MSDDARLLEAFVRNGSQEAFRGLVGRHVDIVHAAACRQVGADDADDVTQAVFIVLAKRAAKVRDPMLLRAWLLKVTHYAAADLRKRETRRRRHEKEARAMRTTNAVDPVDPEWDQLSPHLDAALARLSVADRAAVVAHCIDQMPMAEVAAGLNSSEAAARKRVQRALGRLRSALPGPRGATGAALPALLAAHAVKPAPAGFAAHVATGALGATTGAATAGSAGAIAKGVLTMMGWQSARWAVAGGLLAAVMIGAAIPLARAQDAGRGAVTVAATRRADLAVLPSGVRIEILGITSLVREGTPNTWWNPDGTVLPALDYKYAATEIMGEPSLAVAFRVVAADGNGIGGGELRVLSAGQPGSGQLVTRTRPDGSPEYIHNVSMVSFQPGGAGQPFTVRFELPGGEWVTRVTSTVRPSSTSNISPAPGDLVSMRMRGNDTQVTVVCSDTYTDEQGRLWVDEGPGGTIAALGLGDGAPFRTIEVTVPVDQAKPAKIALQTRPYREFAVFAGFAGAPGAPSTPQVVTGDLPARVHRLVVPRNAAFGEVIERELVDPESGAIDFATGERFPMPIRADDVHSAQVDAWVQTGELLPPGLYGPRMRVVPVTPEAWDAGTAAGLGESVRRGIEGRAPNGFAAMPAGRSGQPPLTYLFATGKGTVGLVQVMDREEASAAGVEPSMRRSGVKVRYKVLQGK